ncbi:MAG: acyltransferase [Promethearchaeota archaeon]
MTDESKTSQEVLESEDSNEISLGRYIGMFFFISWLSLLPSSLFLYMLFLYLNPFSIAVLTGSVWIPLAIIAIGFGLAYVILIFASWSVALVSLRIVTGGKPIKEGKFRNTYKSEEWSQFSKRHVVKKFTMWFFNKCTPRWLYRKYVGTFIKIGKHVEIPKWIAMEAAEIGDNTVIARHAIVSSHLIDGKYISVGQVKIGKNCIIDAEDELHSVTILPGCVVGDNVIIKPGTLLTKGVKVEAGGIYQGVEDCRRIGEVADLSRDELDAYREKVRKNTKIYSKMLDDWSSFTSIGPKIIKFLSLIFGVSMMLLFAALWIFKFIPAITGWFGIAGHVINIALLPFLFLVGNGFQLFLPILIYYAGFKKYEKIIPKLAPEDDAVLEIRDSRVIEAWKCFKWLKWQAIGRVNDSLYLDVSMIIYQHFGDNDVAFRTVLYNSKVDTDYIKIGDNTILSFETHLYAYKLEVEEKDGGREILTLKRTILGKDVVIGSSVLEAGVRVGNGAVVGIYSRVEEDTVIEPGRTYVGNPAMEIKEFLKKKRSSD